MEIKPITSRYNEAEARWDITAAGDIDIYNSGALKDALLLLCKEKEADFCVDCADLVYIDSTGLGALVAVLKTVKGYGGEISLKNVNRSIVKLFRITNLDKAFVIVETTENRAGGVNE